MSKRKHMICPDEKTKGKPSGFARRMSVRAAATWALLPLGIAGAVYGFSLLGTGAPIDVSRECIVHGRLGLHKHSHLTIRVNGTNQPIPAEIGIPSANCMRPVHTHDGTGTLHVEWSSPRDFTLGDFFKVWGEPFSREQLLGHQAGTTHAVTVTVNGVPSLDHEKLLLKDNDRIVIEYKAR